MSEQLNRTLLNLNTNIAVSKDWDVKLCLNTDPTSVHETKGVNPFSMMLGREARLPKKILYMVY